MSEHFFLINTVILDGWDFRNFCDGDQSDIAKLFCEGRLMMVIMMRTTMDTMKNWFEVVGG